MIPRHTTGDGHDPTAATRTPGDATGANAPDAQRHRAAPRATDRPPEWWDTPSLELLQRLLEGLRRLE